jgi:hypothetical protein
MRAIKLVNHDTDICKHCWTSGGLAERSRFVWLQSDWIGSCEQDLLKDRSQDRTLLGCGSELLRGPYGFDLERVVYTT